MYLTIGQIQLFSLGMATGQGEGKLLIQIFALKVNFVSHPDRSVWLDDNAEWV